MFIFTVSNEHINYTSLCWFLMHKDNVNVCTLYTVLYMYSARCTCCTWSIYYWTTVQYVHIYKYTLKHLNCTSLDYWHTNSGTHFHFLYVFVEFNTPLVVQLYYRTSSAWCISWQYCLWSTPLNTYTYVHVSMLWTPVEMYGLMCVMHNQLQFGLRSSHCILGYNYRRCALATKQIDCFYNLQLQSIFLICLSLTTIRDMYVYTGICCWLYRVMSNVWWQLQWHMKFKFPLTRVLC